MLRSASILLLTLLVSTALASVARANNEVILVGAVEKPGRYSASAHKGVVALIIAAGGLRPSGCTLVTISGRVEGKARTYRVNLWELLADFRPDWALQDGDIVSVPEHEAVCLRDEKAVNGLLADYLKACAENTKPADWAQRLTTTHGGDGKTLYHAANKAPGSLPRR